MDCLARVASLNVLEVAVVLGERLLKEGTPKRPVCSRPREQSTFLRLILWLAVIDNLWLWLAAWHQWQIVIDHHSMGYAEGVKVYRINSSRI